MARAHLLIALTIAVGSQYVDAQGLTCFAIRPGDTASLVATRITGDARNRHRSWFQIIDSRTGRIVGKSQYDRIHAGWRACVVQAPVNGRSHEGMARTFFAAPLEALLTGAARVSRAADLTLVLLGVLVIASAFLWHTFDEYVTERQRTLGAMKGFGERFVREFERPLLQPSLDAHPIRSRLQASPDRGRLEILLAPAGRRRYPNLSDHKENVTYDVARVLQLLGDQSFVCAPLRAQGPWVVVPFQFQGCPKEAGGS